MLKFKENKKLEDLIKYGFQLDEYGKYYSKEKVFTVEVESEVEIDIVIRKRDRKVNLMHFVSNDNETEALESLAITDENILFLETIFDLIKDGYIEKI